MGESVPPCVRIVDCVPARLGTAGGREPKQEGRWERRARSSARAHQLSLAPAEVPLGFIALDAVEGRDQIAGLFL